MAERAEAITYSEAQSLDGSRYARTLWILAAIAPLIPLVALVLPRSEPIRWDWLVGALAIHTVLVVPANRMVTRARKAGIVAVPSSLSAALFPLAGLAVMVSLDFALSPASAFVAPLLLVPVLTTASMVRRPSIVVVTTIGALVALVLVETASAARPADDVARMAVALAAALLIVVVVRLLAVATARDAERNIVFGEMSDVTATAESLEEGIRRVLPLVAEYLGASFVALCSSNDRSEVAVAESWSAHDEGGVALVISPDLLKQAEGLRVPITGDDHCLIPVSSDPSRPLVVVASGFAHVEPIRRIHELRLQRVAQQLDVLINRMSVIERLEALTRTDALTGVANRRALMERLDHEMRLSRRTGDQFTAVMVDLDFFKRYNDTFGHLAGDAALVSVASMLHNRLRTTDVVARYGGQQFCLLLTDTTAALARQIVDELRRLIGNIDGPQRLTFSAGLAQWDGNETAEELLNRARDAMHHAKTAGRDQCRSSGEQRQMRPLVSPRVPPGSISLN